MIVFRTRWMGTFIVSGLMNVPIHLPGMIIYVVTNINVSTIRRKRHAP